MIDHAKSLLRPLRPVARRVLDGRDRILHGRRRQKALESLGTVDDLQRLLFVCLGNICRSPYAEWSLRARLGDSPVRLRSAGFIGPGRAPPEEALDSARDRGIEHQTHCSQLVTRELAEWADAIFVFQSAHAKRLRDVQVPASTPVILLGDLDPVWGGRREIGDPWGGPGIAFSQTFERIDRCLGTLQRHLDATRAAR